MSMLLNGKTNYPEDFTDIPVMEGYDVEAGGDAAAHQEFVQEMVSVYEAMHAADMAEIELRRNNNGVALESCTEGLDEFEAVQESAVSGVYEKIKAALRKLWAKIKGFFKSVRKYFDYLFMDGKDFAKKYQTEIIRAAAKADDTFEFKMYKFDDSKIDDVNAGIYDKALKAVSANLDIANKDNEAIEKDILKPFRKSIVGGSGDKEDFSTDAFAFFRSGGESDADKVEVKAADISTFVKVLTTSKTKSALDKMEREMDKSFRNIIKKYDDMEREAAKNDKTDSVKFASKTASAFESCQSIATTFVRIWHQAVKDRASAYKQACMRVMSHKNKKN